MSTLIPPQCYCDPSVVLGYCHVDGCKAYAAIYLIVWGASMYEGSRRIYTMRKVWRTAIYWSNVFLTIGSTLNFVRHVMLLARVVELYSMAVLLTFSVGFWVNAYLLILVNWCDIIINIHFKSAYQRAVRIVKWVIVAFIVLHFVGWIIADTIYWPAKYTNVFIGIYGLGITCGYILLGFLIWREYYLVSHIAAHGDSAILVKEKIKKITKLTVYVSLSAMLFTLTMIVCTKILPKSNGGAVAWMFLTRLPFAIFIFVMHIIMVPSKFERKEASKRTEETAQWSEKMNKLNFTDSDCKSMDQQGLAEPTVLTMQATRSGQEKESTGSSGESDV
ncbi:hypothetical protein SAMD00019534_040990 [Acytostelium subglobosum LB1]|uniref:hypothetical protein n=1 Tax=Acytostelium subglobosum LB1 TaxID=1410327 RepID=UPI000644BB32|nr:hypothetical protein SAMD00019534_040990 [Acytostelium subglobosum LB1]GAM20924.1 hypothetical protein SAMD00019534_040990 [Acytostelium subglobosum LB1]|eukprot:XP_012756058.1 hypothetical protein SAMD00019534_040990 [Acytostelium subglobosum LB1]